MAVKIPQCGSCGRSGHYKTFCTYTAKPPIKVNKRPRQAGKEHERWKQFREEIAIPYLDDKFGHICRCCGIDGDLDIDHIHNKGSRPELKYQLSNLQYLCRHPCHFNKTINKACLH